MPPGNNADDIKIQIGIVIRSATAAMKKLEAQVEASALRMSKAMDFISSGKLPGDLASKGAFEGIFRRLTEESAQLSSTAKGVFQTVGPSVKKVSEAYAEMGSNVLNAQKTQQAYFDSLYGPKIAEQTQKLKQATAAQKKYGQSLARQQSYAAKAIRPIGQITQQLDAQIAKQMKAKHQFAGYAMSIMFFGMALQRMSMGVARFGVKTFQDVMHSVEGSVTSVDMLKSSWTELGFNIGQALEPVMSFLVPIVDTIANWVSENPKLVAGLTTVGIILGTLFMAGGAGKLALDGFYELRNIMLGTKLGAGLAGISLSSPWVIAILAVAAAAALIGKAFKDNDEAAKAAKKSFTDLKPSLDSVKDAVVNLFNSLFDSSLNLEDFAWVAAWAFDILTKSMDSGLKKIELLLEGMAALVDAGQAVYYALKAVSNALWGNFGKAAQELDKAKAQLDSAKKNFSSMWETMQAGGDITGEIMNTLKMGPQGFKEANQSTQTSIYFGDINVQQMPGESAADVINRVLAERGVTQ